ncbi:MAG: carboxypeptidase-like regulatory domain-containing protein [Gemmatimonadetes bacterium]|nr:carboxypeptidase-like regulatory domain-containing protein [Gemmatimonadota bacterium]
MSIGDDLPREGGGLYRPKHHLECGTAMTGYWTLSWIPILALACIGPDLEPEAQDVSGSWQEVRVTASGTANVSALVVADTVTYTLRIKDQNGFIHGTWTIDGDTTLPTDPWAAITTGDYSAGRIITEYHDPRTGRCRLAGPIQPDGFEFIAEQRCESEQWAVQDTFRMFPTPIGHIAGVVSVESDPSGGVTVTLSNGARTTTNADGGYGFSNLEGGTYTIQISDLPEGVLFRVTSARARISQDGETVTVNFRGQYYRTSAILGTVTASNQGLRDIAVSLSGRDTATTTTDNSGQYGFTGLRAGFYTVGISGFDTTQVSFAVTSDTTTLRVGESKIVSFAGTKK